MLPGEYVFGDKLRRRRMRRIFGYYRLPAFSAAHRLRLTVMLVPWLDLQFLSLVAARNVSINCGEIMEYPVRICGDLIDGYAVSESFWNQKQRQGLALF
jgi:hypothetical protein